MDSRRKCLVAIVALACTEPPQDVSSDVALWPTEVVAASARRHLDGDSIPDHLVFVNDTSGGGPARYTRLAVKLTRSGWISWVGEGDSISAHTAEARETVVEGLLALRQATSDGVLLVRIGPGYGCCAPSLSVGLADATGFRVLLEFDQFVELEPPEWNASGVARLVGSPCLSEPVGGGISYRPTLVVVLDSGARIDSVESARRTTIAQGGFVGLSCAPDIISVERADGSRELRVP